MKTPTALFALAALLPLAFAAASPQDYGNSSPSSSKSSSSSAKPSATAAAASSGGKVLQVSVGQSGFVFDPDTLVAAAGDVIQFKVFPTHSLAASSFSSPCEPLSGMGAIWSGFSSNDNTFFSVTVNDTQPVWLYCAAPSHCQAGMSMVINPPSGANTIQAYQSAAKGANTGTPPNIAGGVFGQVQPSSPSSASASGTAAASAAPTTATKDIASGVIVDVMMLAGMMVAGVAYML